MIIFTIRKQTLLLKVRSWEEGHHSSGKKKQSDISTEYGALFTNASRLVINFFKDQKQCQFADVERRVILSKIFQVSIFYVLLMSYYSLFAINNYMHN